MTPEQLFHEGKYQEALVGYNQLIQTNPTAANYLGLAKTYDKLNYTIHAIEALNEGIAKYPQNLDLQFYLAQTYFNEHNLNAAKAILEPLYESNKENLAVVASYLNYLITTNDYKKAKTLIPFLSKHGSHHIGILNNIGLVYVELGDMRSAMQTFRKGFKVFLANPLPKAAPKAQEFMDQEAGKKGLLAIKKALDELGVPFMIAAGTLLGIYRDGELLPHDKDVDLMLPWNTPRAELISALRHYNFVCREREEDINGEKGRYNIVLNHVPTGIVIDLFFLKPEGDKVVHSIYKSGKILSISEKNTGRSQIEYAGETFWTYGDIELYFRDKYGEDWRTPKANHNGLILSNTDGRTYDPHGIGIALCYNHCLGAICEKLYKKAHGYAMQLLSVHDDLLLLEVKNYLENNLGEEWYPTIPYRKIRTNNKTLYGIR